MPDGTACGVSPCSGVGAGGQVVLRDGLELVTVPEVHPPREVAEAPQRKEAAVVTPQDGVAMGVAEEELWLGRGAVVEGGDGRHLAGDHRELGRLGLVGHPADLDDGAARVAREGDVGRLALALPPAVVAEEEVEVGGSVVGLPRLVYGGVGEDKGRVPPGAPLGAALLCLVKGLGGRGRAAAGSFRPEPVRRGEV